MLLLVRPVGLAAQTDFRGRLNLDYFGSSHPELTDRRFNQDLELSAAGDLFVKNRMTLNYFLERLTATRQSDDIVRQRWRGNLVGRYYSFTGELIPRYRLSGSTGSTGEKVTGRRFNLVVSPPGAPITSVTWDWKRKTGGMGTSEIDAVNLDRFVNSSYTYKVFNYRVLLRERKSDNGLAGEKGRLIRDFDTGAGVNASLGGKLNLVADYDFLYTQDRGTPEFEGESVISNVSTRASARPFTSLSGFISFLGNYVERQNDVERRSSLSEIVSGVKYRPLSFLRLSGSRDYRLIREGGAETISDFARGEAVLHGRLRDRMEGRAVVTRTFVISSKDGTFPSQGYLLSFISRFYPGVSLNSDFNVTQSANPERTSGRFQLRRAVDIRAIPTGTMMIDFSLRTLSFGADIPWLSTQVLSYGFDVNYQPTPALAAVVTITREQDRRIVDRKNYLFNSTVNYVFRSGSSLSVIYNRRGASEIADGVTETENVSPGGAEEGLFLQLTLKLKNRSNLRLSFDTRRVQAGQRAEDFGVNFVKWF